MQNTILQNHIEFPVIKTNISAKLNQRIIPGLEAKREIIRIYLAPEFGVKLSCKALGTTVLRLYEVFAERSGGKIWVKRSDTI